MNVLLPTERVAVRFKRGLRQIRLDLESSEITPRLRRRVFRQIDALLAGDADPTGGPSLHGQYGKGGVS